MRQLKFTIPLTFISIRKMKKTYLAIILLLATITTYACTCPLIKITNAFSHFEFIAIVEFQSLHEIENNPGYYQSKFKINELFKGNNISELLIVSGEGSTCGFSPRINTKYFILGYKNEEGLIETSYCLTYNSPDDEKLSILRELAQKEISVQLTPNLRQELVDELNSTLFEELVTGTFLYEVILNSDLEIIEIIACNANAERNFNEQIKKEIKQKIKYERFEENQKIPSQKISSFILLSWTENYENEKVITATKI